MFQIAEYGDELIIKEFPVWNWAVFFWCFCYGFFIFYTDLLEYLGISIPTVAQILLVASFCGTLTYIFSPVVKIHINKHKKFIKISKENLVKNQYKIYSFEQIEDVIFVKEKKALFDSGFQMILPLKNGDKIKLSSRNRSKKKEYIETAERLNTFIFNAPKHIP